MARQGPATIQAPAPVARTQASPSRTLARQAVSPVPQATARPAGATLARPPAGATLARAAAGVSQGGGAISGARQAAQSLSGGLDGAAAAGAAGGGTAGADSDAAYHDLLQRLREEQEQLGQLIPHPF